MRSKEDIEFARKNAPGYIGGQFFADLATDPAMFVMLFPILKLKPEYMPLQKALEDLGYDIINIFLKEYNYILDEC